MSRYLLDTNAGAELMKDPVGRVGQRIALLPDANLCTSVIVMAELRYGAARRQSSKLARQIEAILVNIPVMPWGPPADVIYGELRAEREASGTPIGAHGMPIAAHALALDCTPITDNEGEFRRVPGLLVENWLRAA